MSDSQFATPFADPTDTLLGWASQTELNLTRMLAEHPYFPDCGWGNDKLEKLERFYGIFLARQLAAGADMSALINVTPAMLSVTLISWAAHNSERETFLHDYLVGLGLSPDEDREATLVSNAPELVRRAGLATVDGASPADLIFAHTGGLTAAEIPHVLEALDRHEGDIDAVLEEDLPILRRSYELFPEKQRQILEGIVALREFSMQHPSSWLDRDRTHLRPKLPVLVDEAVTAELRERPAGTFDRASAVGVATRELRPRIIFDGAAKRIRLRLPQQRVAENDVVSWRVSLEGTTRVFRTGRPWGEPTYAEALDITLQRQVRELTVQDVSHSITWVVPIIDSDDPVLLFAAVNGENLSDKESLHHSAVIAIAPEDSTFVDVVTGEDIPTANEFALRGWDGWRGVELDLSSAASLQVLRPGQQPSPMHRLRCVDPRRRVRFRNPSAPIPGVTTSTGLPLYDDSLHVDFPPTVSGDTETWWLSISSFAGAGRVGEEISEPEAIEVPAEGGSFAIFDPEAYDAPWVGEYLIRLRGPRNESFRHQFALVEGMRATQEILGACHSFRIPAQGGLSEARLQIRHNGEKPFEVSPEIVHVSADEASAEFLISTEAGDCLPLRFTPSRLAVEVPVVTHPPMWRASRFSCLPQDFDAEGTLRIRGTKDMGDPKIAVRNQHGSPLRTLKLTTEDGGRTYTAAMKELAASCAVLPSGSLELEWTDHSADRRISVSLAQLTTTPHATGVHVEDDCLIFDDLAEERMLGAWLWPMSAPWVPGEKISISAKTELPEQFREAGPLAVQIFTDDPFMVLRAPQVPGPNAFTVEQPGYFKAQPPALAELSAFLSGEAEEAPTDPQVMPILWDNVDVSSNRAAILDALGAHPGAALRALSDSLVPADQQPGRIIAAGLVNKPFATDLELLSDSEVHRTAWIGAMELLGQLPRVWKSVEDGETPRSELRERVQRVGEVVGQELVDTLSTGRDKTLDSACIDQSTVAIARMDATQQETLLQMFFANAGIVPGAMMQDSARLMAVFECFKKREELIDLLSSEDLIKPAVTLLRALRGNDRSLYACARIRFDKLDGVNTEARENAWALAPVVSLVFALSARLHAHGLMGKSKTLDKAALGWSRLANVVPELVTGDIISAEAMVLAARYPGIAG